MNNHRVQIYRSGLKNCIPFWSFEATYKIYVRVHKKPRLNELYPQRALIEEARKESSLVKANDWINHEFYEEQVVQSIKTNQRIIDKYGVKLPRN